ncbi:MAG TPA: RluA family pseudouridine synthase [bacterium]|nr:RluA family pseudouridine synthase [bacterium]
MTVTIHLEDPDFVIVEKPVGISTQPLSSRRGMARHSAAVPPRDAPTLAHQVSASFPEIQSVGGSDWGAVHRLDRETSGLVVFARNQKAYEALRRAFSKNEVEKEYAALVEGEIQQAGTINWPIGPDPKSDKRVKVYRNVAEARRMKAQEAVTIYMPVGANLVFAPSTLLRVTIKSGRRHQIRAHLAALGHPIIGDEVYGSPQAGRTQGSPLRLHLHASRLRFRHPRTDLRVEASSPASFSEAPV